MLYCHLCEQYKDQSHFADDGVGCRECEDSNVVERLRTEPAYREGLWEGLRKAYSQYRWEAGDHALSATDWAFDVLPPEIWNELFQAKQSSHGVRLNGLTREQGRKMGGGLK